MPNEIENLVETFGESFIKYINKEGINSESALDSKLDQNIKEFFKLTYNKADIVDNSELKKELGILGKFLKFLIIRRLNQNIRKSKIVEIYFKEERNEDHRRKWLLSFEKGSISGGYAVTFGLDKIAFSYLSMLSLFTKNIKDTTVSELIKKNAEKKGKEAPQELKDLSKNATIQWGSTGKNAVFKIVDHEFGHLIHNIIAYKKQKSRKHKLELRNEKLSEITEEFHDVITEIEDNAESLPDAKLVVEIKDLCRCFLESYDSAVGIELKICYDRNKDIVKQIEKMKEKLKDQIKKFNVSVPERGPSQYAESDQMEFFAETRSNSKAKIYSDIKKELSYNMKTIDDFNKLKKMADGNFKGIKDEDREKAKKYLEQLTSREYVWGLAYRILNFDNQVNMFEKKYGDDYKMSNSKKEKLEKLKASYNNAFTELSTVVKKFKNKTSDLNFFKNSSDRKNDSKAFEKLWKWHNKYKHLRKSW